MSVTCVRLSPPASRTTTSRPQGVPHIDPTQSFGFAIGDDVRQASPDALHHFILYEQPTPCSRNLLEAEGQEGSLLMAIELLNMLTTCSQQTNDFLIGTVAHSKPNNLWRRASNNAQTKKILVARDIQPCSFANRHTISSGAPPTPSRRTWSDSGYMSVIAGRTDSERFSSNSSRTGPQTAGIDKVRRSRSAA